MSNLPQGIRDGNVTIRLAVSSGAPLLIELNQHATAPLERFCGAQGGLDVDWVIKRRHETRGKFENITRNGVFTNSFVGSDFGESARYFMKCGDAAEVRGQAALQHRAEDLECPREWRQGP